MGKMVSSKGCDYVPLRAGLRPGKTLSHKSLQDTGGGGGKNPNIPIKLGSVEVFS